jgi:hypothetical protein
MDDTKPISELEYIPGPNCGLRILDLYDLIEAARNRRSVICPKSGWAFRPIPAAIMINQTGATLYNLMSYGMFIYIPKKKTNVFSSDGLKLLSSK